MIIELNNLTNQNTRINRELKLGEAQSQLTSSIHLDKVKVNWLLQGKPGGEFTLKGDFQADLTCACVRCLKEFDLNLDKEVDVLFVPFAEMDSDVELELKENDLNVSSYVDTIDLIQIVEEQVALALPMRAMCSDDCVGLCSGCGKATDHCTCEVETETVDERLLVLKEIKERMLQRKEK